MKKKTNIIPWISWVKNVKKCSISPKFRGSRRTRTSCFRGPRVGVFEKKKKKSKINFVGV